MKINAVFLKKPGIKYRRAGISEADKSLIVISAVILASIFAGALAYALNRNAFGGELWNGFFSLFTNANGKSFVELFSGFYVIELFTIILLSVFGTASYGQLPAIAVIILRTVGIGTIGAYLYDNYLSVGFKYFSVIILPGKLLLFFGLLLAAQNALQTSKKTKQCIDGKTGETVDRKLFMLRNGVCAVIFALSALLDAALMYFASGKIPLYN